MVFSSLSFIYYFLPCVLILYMLSPRHLKNAVLLISSLIFYAWGEPKYVIIMLASIASGYCFGLLIEHFREKHIVSKTLLGLSVITSLSSLLYFKYANFFIDNFNRVFGISMPLLKVVLPIGISFYTFQILSYTIDVYRGTSKAQKNPINLAAYISFFPQLIAGPIVRYSDVETQLSTRKHSIEKISCGIKRFVCGLSKKIILANTFGEFCSLFLSSNEKSVVFYWLYAFSFMLQIYFDFSGYSDMAIGLGKLFGFDFPENFSYPFCSKSITDFWRRWHMTLGSWFRDYVYIPMGGSRCSKPKMIFNIFTVWMLTGFWHGAQWNFILWGLYFAILLCAEKFLFLSKIERAKFFRHIYVLFFVTISFVIFSTADITETFRHINAMFGFGKLPFVNAESLYYLKSFGAVFAIGIICSTPLLKNIKIKISSNPKFDSAISLVAIPVMLALVVVCTAYLVDGSFNPFLYFRF